MATVNPTAMTRTTRDTRLIFIQRSLRAFGFGYLSVLLALYLPHFGFGAADLGFYLSAATLSGIALNFLMMRVADRMGRRRTIALSAALLALSGIALAAAQNPWLLMVAALLGTVPPGGNGVFSTVEQAMIGNVAVELRTGVFGRYGLWAAAATAAGSLAASLPGLAAQAGLPEMAGYRLMMVLYAVIGAAIVGLALSMSPHVEFLHAGPSEKGRERVSLFGLRRSHNIMMRMAGLFVADSFGSAIMTTSLLAYFLHAHFHVAPFWLAVLFFGIRALEAVSYPLAILISRRLGLLNTAVFTHIPSSLLLMAVPLVPTAALASVLLLVRGLLVQMDVPTRQAYISAIVDPEERAAAAGVTTLGRQTGQLVGPGFGGLALSMTATLAFVVSGGIKIAYDVALWLSFRHLEPQGHRSEHHSEQV